MWASAISILSWAWKTVLSTISSMWSRDAAVCRRLLFATNGLPRCTCCQPRKRVTELRSQFDFTIIDSPAGIEGGFQNAIAGADEVVIVSTPHVSSIRDADRVIGLLEAAEKQQIYLVINRLQAEMVRRGDMLDIPDILDILAIELLGTI